MKSILCIVILALIAQLVRAQTNLTELLQQGMFEEQANHNLDAAISNYQALSTQFDKDRQLAATAIFRLGECYREEGLTNQAAVEYRRILNEFQDQKTLALLSQEDLAGMSAAVPATAGTTPTEIIVPRDNEDQEIARIQQMIQNSPDLINAPDDHGHTPLEKAAMDGSLKVAAFLLDHGADVNAGKFSALNLAANAGNRAMVEFLLVRGANISAKAWTGETPLHTAASEGYKAVVETLLANKADINARDDSGATPLLEAARNGHPQTVRTLLNAGADPNIADKDGRTPLSFAAGSGSAETVKALLAAKADPNGGTVDAPLLCAIDKKDLASAELLLQAGADPNTDGLMHCPQGSYGSKWYGEYSAALRKAPALWLAIQKDQLPMVQLLLKYKANPDNSQISEPPSAIFWALSNNNILQALLNAGADPNLVRSDGRTPLSIAAETGLLDAVKLLLAAKADPNGDLSDTPLVCAVFQNDPEIVQVLLQAGANPNLGTRNPVRLAAYRLNEGILRLLLNAGANPNVQNEQGDTPLRILESANWNDEQKTVAASMADLLRQHGAMENLPNWDRITVNRPSTKTSQAVIYKGTNNWNRFTLMELLSKVDYSDSDRFPFPDFAHITDLRPNGTGEISKRIPVNLLNSTNGIECSRDVPLEFGDVVEVPEREHTLAENDTQTDKIRSEMSWFLKEKAGSAKLIVDGGQTIQLPLKDFEPVTCYLGDILASPICRSVLMSDSDLSRVHVTRRYPKTEKLETWTVDLSGHRWSSNPNELWVRDGDVIEVPESKSD